MKRLILLGQLREHVKSSDKRDSPWQHGGEFLLTVSPGIVSVFVLVQGLLKWHEWKTTECKALAGVSSSLCYLLAMLFTLVPPPMAQEATCCRTASCIGGCGTVDGSRHLYLDKRTMKKNGEERKTEKTQVSLTFCLLSFSRGHVLTKFTYPTIHL